MFRKLMILAVVAWGAAGCVKPPIQGRMEPYVENQVNFAQEDLRRKTAIGLPSAVRDDFGLLHVTVPIRAATNLQLYVDYRVTFLDAQGQVVGNTSWISKTLAPNVFDQISVNSTTPRAADFRLDLRYAK